jgi:sugar lactone lactonase YvrE
MISINDEFFFPRHRNFFSSEKPQKANEKKNQAVNIFNQQGKLSHKRKVRKTSAMTNRFGGGVFSRLFSVTGNSRKARRRHSATPLKKCP